MNVKKFLIENFGKLYSEELGINLKSKKEKEIFKWFMASVLFGKRINETIAKNTFNAMMKYKLTSPRAIIKFGWFRLVRKVMREGGYVRYDGMTSQYLLDISKKLIEDYGGKVTNIEKKAKDSKDLERRLLEFRGIGPTTVNIFLRELRGIWKKANPDIGKYTLLAANNLKISKRDILKNKRLEVALLRIGKDYCHRKRCKSCPLVEYCPGSSTAERLPRKQ